MNGDRRWMSMHCRDSKEILEWLSLLSKQAGDTQPIRYRKNWHTDVPSIQGPWSPWTRKNPDDLLATFPNEKLGEPLDMPETATEKLMRLYNVKKSQ